MSAIARFSRWIADHAGALAVPALAIVALIAVILLWSPTQPAGDQSSSDVWTCSMHPQVRLPKPGPCPICGMAMIPVAQLGAEQQRTEAAAGLETEPVAYRELFKEIRTVGKLDYDERRLALITARVDGRIDRVYADFTGIRVKPNDHLVDIYSPELYAAQAELLRTLERSANAADRAFVETTLEASRIKLRLLGILPEQIDEIERARRETSHLTIYAPIGGVIIEKNVREQQYVTRGEMLYRIADLDPIWLYLDIYEYDLGWIRYGHSVDVSLEAYPGETFTGKIMFVDPFLNDETRTVKVRVNLPNPEHRLKPAMYASAVIQVPLDADGKPKPTGLEGKYVCPMHPEIVADAPGRCSICDMPLEKVPDLSSPAAFAARQPPDGQSPPAGQVLAIRKSAVLDTGRRQVTYRKRDDGAFELVELRLGPLAQSRDEAGRAVDYYPVFEGLAADDEVVVQGGFLLDSERQIQGMPSVLYAEGRSAASLHAGHGGGSVPAAPAAPAPGASAPPATAPAGGHQH